MTPSRLKRRADFVAAGKGVRAHGAMLTVQAGRRAGPADAGLEARIGFTITKKVGNAVVRNRIRRRLREAVRLSDHLSTAPQTDYVVVARRDALKASFTRLRADLEATMRRGGERLAGGKGAAGHRRRGAT